MYFEFSVTALLLVVAVVAGKSATVFTFSVCPDELLNVYCFSAPFTVLDEKLGYTPQNIFREVKKFLAE